MVQVESKPDPQTGEVTRLVITADLGTVPAMSVWLIKSAQSQAELLKASLADVFDITFYRFDLKNKRMTGEFVNYRSSRLDFPPDATQAGATVQMVYLAKAAQSASLPQFDSIRVTLTISPSIDPRNYGWINMDIQHTFPPQIKSGVDDGFAWEAQIKYPTFKFNPAEVPNYRSLPGPLKFAAFYKQVASTRARVEGLAAHVGDSLGQRTEISFQEPSADDPSLRLTFKLTNSMHLLNGVYVRPATYDLFSGDRFGYGGNLMVYRVRAFQIEAVCDGAPVNWYDVANIYRNWLKSWQPDFYTKYKKRTQPAPVDTLSPHTLISNYGLSGQIDPSARDPRFPDLYKWLELHPVKDGAPDMPGNQNESLLGLLSRTRSVFNTWSGWEDLGKPQSAVSISSGPAVASWAANRLDCFVRGGDGQMWHKWWDGSAWSNWEPQGGVLTSAPAAVSWGPNRIDCFVRGTDMQMWHKRWDGSGWSGWNALGGGLASAPAVASWAANRLDCFVRGTDDALYTQWWDGSRWSGWVRIEGEALVNSSPGVVSWGPNRVDCFVRGKDNTLRHKWFDGQAWNTGWENLGAPSDTIRLASAPAISRLGLNRLEVFVRGTDNALWQLVWDGAWHAWERLGGNFTDDPAAVSWGADRIDCFVRGATDTMLHKWSGVYTPLEAQLWGFEMGGFYHFFGGVPPATEAISGDGTKFKRAMDELVSRGIFPLVTTDPLAPVTDQRRYAGHVILDANRQWQEAIRYPFPQGVSEKTCADTDVKIGGKQFSRVFYVLPDPKVEPPQRTCADALRLHGSSLKVNPDGTSTSGPAPALGSGMYRAYINRLCPTKDLEDTYVGAWLGAGLLSRGVRLVEFMKHNPLAAPYCYDRTHQHIIPKPAPPPDNPDQKPPYDNAIGTGYWYTRRIQTIFERAFDNGLNASPVFALSHEFTPTEPLIPYVDDYYEGTPTPNVDEYYKARPSSNFTGQGGNPVFHFVYSALVRPKMHLFRDFETHAGYREGRKSLQRARPAYMLDPARDLDAQPLTVDEIEKASPAEWPGYYAYRAQTFKTWRDECDKYFNANFKVAQYGIAPRGYPVESSQAVPNFDPNNPTAETTPPSYTFIRCVQDVFNLRAVICELGARAVIGERVILSSLMLEEPYDYNEEAVRMSARAFRLHQLFLKFFRDGAMLGETAVRRIVYLPERPETTFDGNRLIWAWGSAFRVPRPFDDVAPLVAAIRKDDAQLETAPPQILDFISRPVDRESLKYTPTDPAPFFRNEVIVYRQVPHMVWQYGAGDAREILYAFANIGNTDSRVEFLYGRGFEGTSPATAWRKTITVVSGSEVNQTTVTAPLLGKTELSLTIPARSFAAVSIKR